MKEQQEDLNRVKKLYDNVIVVSSSETQSSFQSIAIVSDINEALLLTRDGVKNLIYIVGSVATHKRDVLILGKQNLTILASADTPSLFTEEIIITKCKNVKIDGLTLRSSDISVPFRLSVHESEDVFIENCNIGGSLRVIDSLKYSIRNCDIHPLSETLLLSEAALFVGSTFTTDVNTYLMNEMVIENNRIHNSPGVGVVISKVIPTVGSKFYNNRVYLNREGGMIIEEVHQSDESLLAPDVFFFNNVISDNVPFGISVCKNSFISGKSNSIYGHITAIGVESMARFVLSDSFIYDNDICLVIHDGVCTFTNNVLEARNFAVDIITDTSNAKFIKNKFIAKEQSQADFLISFGGDALTLFEENEFGADSQEKTFSTPLSTNTTLANNTYGASVTISRDTDADEATVDLKWNNIAVQKVPQTETPIEKVTFTLKYSLSLGITPLQQDKLQKYEDQLISFEYPAEWKMEKRYCFTDVQLKSGNRVKDNIGLQTVIAPVRVEQSAQDILDQLEGHTIIEPITTVLVSKDQRKAAVFRAKYSYNNDQFDQLTIVVDCENCLKQVVTYTSSDPFYQNLSKFYEIFNTMQFNTFLETPWSTIPSDTFTLSVPYLWQTKLEKSILFLFSPLQQVSNNLLTDNINLQVVKTDLSVSEYLQSLIAQLASMENFELLQETQITLTSPDRETAFNITQYSFGDKNLKQYSFVIDAGNGVKILFLYTSAGAWSLDIVWEILNRFVVNNNTTSQEEQRV